MEKRQEGNLEEEQEISGLLDGLDAVDPEMEPTTLVAVRLPQSIVDRIVSIEGKGELKTRSDVLRSIISGFLRLTELIKSEDGLVDLYSSAMRLETFLENPMQKAIYMLFRGLFASLPSEVQICVSTAIANRVMSHLLNDPQAAEQLKLPRIDWELMTFRQVNESFNSPEFKQVFDWLKEFVVESLSADLAEGSTSGDGEFKPDVVYTPGEGYSLPDGV